MMSFQYWLGGSPQNLESMLLMLAKEFVSGASISSEAIAEPVLIPDKGIWHPMAMAPGAVYETVEDYNQWQVHTWTINVSFLYLKVVPFCILCILLSC